MPIITIIVAAGRGTRAGDGLPKQYRPVGGRPLLAHTLDAFLAHEAAGPIVCAIHPDDRALYDESVRFIDDPRLRPPVAGGATRQASVRAALTALDGEGLDDALCLVHDAARPFVTAALIGRAVAAAERHGAAVPGVAVTDTVKRVGPDGAVRETVPREELRAVQTPQAFRFGALLDAHRRADAASREDFTDDGHLAEWAGLAVHVFEGDPLNSKVTHPADFADAERRLAGLPPAGPLTTRVGTGFDVHAFAETGDHVWLGGVRIDHDRGVLAHSDGDVVLHALTDALLGALCDGDIGTHFPPSDPRWKGAASDRFLAYAADKVRGAGGVIDHLDATVLCERPRVGPHREAMRAAIAAAAGIPPGHVSIKATTTEKLGFTGRAEGLAAQAAATIRLPVPS